MQSTVIASSWVGTNQRKPQCVAVTGSEPTPRARASQPASASSSRILRFNLDRSVGSAVRWLWHEARQLALSTIPFVLLFVSYPPALACCCLSFSHTNNPALPSLPSTPRLRAFAAAIYRRHISHLPDHLHLLRRPVPSPSNLLLVRSLDRSSSV
jgi:hypothetical protein